MKKYMNYTKTPLPNIKITLEVWLVPSKSSKGKRGGNSTMRQSATPELEKKLKKKKKEIQASKEMISQHFIDFLKIQLKHH